MKKIVCLDFDGVLCDSIDECLLVAYNTFFGRLDKKLKYVSEDIKQYFYSYRYLVRRAGGYFLIFKAFEIGMHLLDYKSFRLLERKYNGELLEFEELFFKVRNELKKNGSTWLLLHRLYPNAFEFIKNYRNRFFIITTKDYDSVERLSKHFNYYNKIIKIYSKEISSDKRYMFKKLIKLYSYDPSNTELIYVDDNVEHLESLRDLNINLFFATWGCSKVSDEKQFNAIKNLMEIV